MSQKVELNRGIGALIDMILQISMLRPSQEQAMPQHSRTRVSPLSLIILRKNF